MIEAICNFVSKHLNKFTISKDGVDYLSRYYLLGKNRSLCNIFLHHFHASDQDMSPEGVSLLHNHPWGRSFGLILTKGYTEERLNEDGSITVKRVKPGHINLISDKDFHRVVLHKGDMWTLFFTGPTPKNANWYFYNPETKEKILWSEVAGAIE